MSIAFLIEEANFFRRKTRTQLPIALFATRASSWLHQLSNFCLTERYSGFPLQVSLAQRERVARFELEELPLLVETLFDASGLDLAHKLQEAGLEARVVRSDYFVGREHVLVPDRRNDEGVVRGVGQHSCLAVSTVRELELDFLEVSSLQVQFEQVRL